MVRCSNIAGFSLIELLITLLLSSLLMLGLLDSYLAYKASNRFAAALASIQERVRFISFFLREKITVAGDARCEQAKTSINWQKAIRGYQALQASTFIRGKLEPNSSVVIIGACRLYKGQQKFVRMAYYIANSGRHNAAGNTIYSLYQQPINGRREELVANVRRMQIRYGVINTSNLIKLLLAQDVKDWLDVRSVAIDVLLVSQRIVSQQQGYYWFAGHRKLAPDKRLYVAWPIYINIGVRKETGNYLPSG